MTKRANRRYIAIGVVAVCLAWLSAWWHQQTGFEFAYYLAGTFMLAAFVLLFVLGIAPWAVNFSFKYPLQNTQGYKENYGPEPKKEIGPYMSQGWRRKQERWSMLRAKALGLYIEPDDKG